MKIIFLSFLIIFISLTLSLSVVFAQQSGSPTGGFSSAFSGGSYSVNGATQFIRGLSPLISFPLGSFLISGGASSIGSGGGSGGGSKGTKPFGGQVTVIRPCNDGLLVTVKEPMGKVQDYMWQWGNLPYEMHVPPHPGQYLLGRALTITEPCIIGIASIGAGFPIMFHGSGI